MDQIFQPNVRLAEWVQKNEPYIFYLKETHFRSQGHIQTESEKMERVFHENRNQKKAGIAIIIGNFKKFKVKGKQKIE